MIDDFQIRNLLSYVIYVVVAHELVKALIIFFISFFRPIFFIFFNVSKICLYVV